MGDKLHMSAVQLKKQELTPLTHSWFHLFKVGLGQQYRLLNINIHSNFLAS